jgi:tRNA pseudouridine38-40 synthase
MPKAATVTYDGTRYFGWQKTKYGPSIQEELQKAIHKITGHVTLPEAASRTDRGVHAHGQVVSFVAPPCTLRALNAVLPPDIRITAMEEKNFHPTLDALGKEYHYRLGVRDNPTERSFVWQLPKWPDFERMEESTKHLIGTHDFSAFANEKKENPICTITSIEIGPTIVIRGNRFLYKMVRNIVGSLIKLSPGEILEALHSKDRKKAGPTAPAHGLYLHQVFYSL